MAAPKIAFIDLRDDSPDHDDNESKKNKSSKKPRISLPHDRPQNLTCWVCKKVVMIHKKKVLVPGRPSCKVCGRVLCSDDEYGSI